MRVIANSLPKSGTHILVRFLELLNMKEEKPHLSASLVRLTEKNPLRRYIKKRRIWKEGMQGEGLKVDLDIPENMVQRDWLKKRLDAVPDNSFLQAHLPYSEKLENLLLSLNYKIIYIVRDPRDVAISMCNYIIRMENEYFHSEMIKANTDIEKLSIILPSNNINNAFSLNDRIKNSIGWLKSPDICSTRFEYLIGNKGGGDIEKQLREIKRITNYLGIHLADDFLYTLCSQIFYPKAKTFHKGQIGSWRNVFTNDMHLLFKQYCGDTLINLGYENDDDW